MPTGDIHNEKELLRQIANGDERAFRSIFDAYHHRLYFYILQISSSQQVAEDIVQDTFLKIWLHRDQLPQVEQFNAYIFRVARNTVLSSLRRKALETVIVEQKLEPVPGAPDAHEQLHIKLVKEVLQQAVNALPEQQQKVYRLRREGGLSIKEVARLLGISEITVKRHLTLATKTLREVFDYHFPADSAILLIILGLLYP